MFSHLTLWFEDLFQQMENVSMGFIYSMWSLNVVKLSLWVQSLFGKRQILKFRRCTVVFLFIVTVGVKMTPFWHFLSQFWLGKTDLVAKSFTSTSWNYGCFQTVTSWGYSDFGFQLPLTSLSSQFSQFPPPPDWNRSPLIEWNIFFAASVCLPWFR